MGRAARPARQGAQGQRISTGALKLYCATACRPTEQWAAGRANPGRLLISSGRSGLDLRACLSSRASACRNRGGRSIVHPSRVLSGSLVQDHDRGSRRRGVAVLRVPRHRRVHHRQLQRPRRQDDRVRHLARRHPAEEMRRLTLWNMTAGPSSPLRSTTTTSLVRPSRMATHPRLPGLAFPRRPAPLSRKRARPARTRVLSGRADPSRDQGRYGQCRFEGDSACFVVVRQKRATRGSAARDVG